MRLLCFDPYRCTDLPNITYIKPELLFRQRDEALAADWVLFPPSWLVNTLVYAMKRRIFPNLASYHLGYDKMQMTRAFQAVSPANVPETRIVAADPRGIEEVLDCFTFPVVVKEPRNSMGRGVHLVEDAAALRASARRLDMLYVQEYLPIDRDLRVVWVGDRVVAAYWRVAAEGAFHNNVARGGRISFDEIPGAAVQLVERMAQALEINHAGFDVAMVDGHPYLLEFNLLFGNEALNRTGIRLGPIILDYLQRLSVPPREPGTPLSRAV